MTFYPPDQVDASQALYHKIRDWGIHRDDVTLIGGWAVWELVDPAADSYLPWITFSVTKSRL